MNRRAGMGRVARDETVDDFLASEGLLGEAEELALEEINADQVRVAMKARGLTKTEPRE
jgi:antitoxin HicB